MNCGLRIRDWERKFESARSAAVKNRPYCMVPNKKTGRSFQLLRKERKWLEIYGVFILMISWCSQQPPPREGCLSVDGTEGGDPFDEQDISIVLGIELSVVRRAVAALTKPGIEWLVPIHEQTNSDKQPEDSVRPQRGLVGDSSGPCRGPLRAREEEKRREEKSFKEEGSGAEDARETIQSVGLDLHPAVKKFISIFGKSPSLENAQRIANKVGTDAIALVTWGDVLSWWVAKHYQAGAVSGPLEWFEKEMQKV